MIQEDVVSENREQPLVTVDVVILTIRPDSEGEQSLHALLVQRKSPPFPGHWAIPGGFVRHNETLDHAAARELFEETGVRDVFLEQLYTFGDPGRDPRDRVITIAYYALVPSQNLRLAAGGDTSGVCWFPVSQLPEAVAFDHRKILEKALARLRNKVEYSSIAFQLLSPIFTMAQLRHVHEVILQRKLDPGNFIHKALASGVVEPTDQLLSGNRHRPPRLYRFTGVHHQNGSTGTNGSAVTGPARGSAP
jgi:8-oxo-dGTP diphosphatase